MFSLPLFVRWNWAESPPSAHSGKGGDDSLLILQGVEGGSHSTAAGCSPPGEPGSFGPSGLKMKRGHVTSQTTCQGSGWRTGSFAHGIAGTRFQCALSHIHTHTHARTKSNKEISSFLDSLEIVGLKACRGRVRARAPWAVRFARGPRPPVLQSPGGPLARIGSTKVGDLVAASASGAWWMMRMSAVGQAASSLGTCPLSGQKMNRTQCDCQTLGRGRWPTRFPALCSAAAPPPNPTLF